MVARLKSRVAELHCSWFGEWRFASGDSGLHDPGVSVLPSEDSHGVAFGGLACFSCNRSPSVDDSEVAYCHVDGAAPIRPSCTSIARVERDRRDP
jgi:hypothetical protein